MRLKKTFYIFLISLILLNLSLVHATNINNANNKYFRIHIVANSDSIDDQLLKCTVAKKVDEYITNITQNSKTKNESKQIIEQNIQTILNICNETIKENNENYFVHAYIGKIAYEKKYMNNIYMPSGTYDSLKIVIGNGNGQNWWSLIYPTSFNDTTIEEIFSEDTTYSLGIIEFFKNVFTKNKANYFNM